MSRTTDDVERPNPPRRGVRKGLYLVPSAFTAANIGMGFYSVMSSLRGFQLLGSAAPDLAAATAHFDEAPWRTRRAAIEPAGAPPHRPAMT